MGGVEENGASRSTSGATGPVEQAGRLSPCWHGIRPCPGRHRLHARGGRGSDDERGIARGRDAIPGVPTGVAPSGILLITPATVFPRRGDSVTFSALLSAAPGSDLLVTGAQWSVDDGRVGSVAVDGTLTALQNGRAYLVARRSDAVATHPIEVGNEEPLTWSGTYVPTSCTSDCEPSL